MEVPGGDRAQRRMARDDLGQRFSLSCGQVDLVPLRDAGRQRRVVHHEDRRPLSLPAQLRVEPAELLRLEGTGVLAGNVRVEDDEAKLADVGGVVDRLVTLTRQVEGLPQASAV